MRAIFQWNIGSRVLELGRRTLIMGIVNVTPDSFSDGGLYVHPDQAVAHAEYLIEDGASMIDVGGESTRPGAGVMISGSEAERARTPVLEEEERKRAVRVIQELKRRRPETIVSVDTYKAGVARAAVEAGAEIVNDISGFRWEPKMATTA